MNTYRVTFRAAESGVVDFREVEAAFMATRENGALIFWDDEERVIELFAPGTWLHAMAMRIEDDDD